MAADHKHDLTWDEGLWRCKIEGCDLHLRSAHPTCEASGIQFTNTYHPTFDRPMGRCAYLSHPDWGDRLLPLSGEMPWLVVAGLIHFLTSARWSWKVAQTGWGEVCGPYQPPPRWPAAPSVDWREPPEFDPLSSRPIPGVPRGFPDPWAD